MRINFFFNCNISNDFFSNDGATIISKKLLLSIFARSDFTFLLSKTTPPKALTGSDSRALKYALLMFFADPTPHGLLCFIITQVGSINSLRQFSPSSTSRILLYPRSLPQILALKILFLFLVKKNAL